MAEAESETVLLLRLIAERLDALPGLIASAAHAGTSLSRRDRQALEGLLPALSHEFGDDSFVVRDAMDAANAPSLRNAIVKAVGTVDRSGSLKLGKLLARADGLSVGEYRIDAQNRSKRIGTVWRVWRSSSQIAANPPPVCIVNASRVQ